MLKRFSKDALSGLVGQLSGLVGHDALRPQGGNLVKNAFAASLVALGKRRLGGVKDWRLINQRVLPKPGEEPSYNDSFVFQGSSPQGDMFMSRLGFREGGSKVEVWVLLKLGDRLIVNTNTLVLRAVDADPRLISAGGLSYVYDPSRKAWKIAFAGALEGVEDAAIELVYTPRATPYLSSVHMDSWSTGKAMAEMPWSRAYFEELRSERQVRIEEGGHIEGWVELDGVRHELNLRAFRDHSWGKRRWSFINRYIWNILSLNEPLVLSGDPYRYICYTTVDYGSTFRHLVSGWIAGPNAILPIVASSDMHTLAADGTIPEVYPLIFQPKGERPLRVEVRRSTKSQAWLVQDGAFEVNEAPCTFLIKEISGQEISGQGMSEFGFSKHSGIPRPIFS